MSRAAVPPDPVLVGNPRSPAHRQDVTLGCRRSVTMADLPRAQQYAPGSAVAVERPPEVHRRSAPSVGRRTRGRRHAEQTSRRIDAEGSWRADVLVQCPLAASYGSIPWLLAELLRPCRASSSATKSRRSSVVRPDSSRCAIRTPGVRCKASRRATSSARSSARSSAGTRVARLSPHVLAYPEVLLERVRRRLLNDLFRRTIRCSRYVIQG